MRARPFLPVMFLGVLLLSACVPQPATHPPEPSPSATPVFASEEEALAAAVTAYEAYLKVSDEIAADGGAHPERLKDLVTEEWYEKEVEGFEKIQLAQMFQRGSTAISDVELQHLSNRMDGVEVVVYLCVDFSGTTFVNVQGDDVTPESRALAVKFQVAFEGHSAHDVLINGSEPWSSSC